MSTYTIPFHSQHTAQLAAALGIIKLSTPNARPRAATDTYLDITASALAIIQLCCNGTVLTCNPDVQEILLSIVIKAQRIRRIVLRRMEVLQ